MIRKTTSLQKISSLKKRIKIIRGGQGAGKTISILILLINHALRKPDREILILSSELTKMRLTVIKDFVKIMRLIGIYEESKFLAGTLYKFSNGSFIKFIGLDKSDVGKGLRSDVAYFNEVNKIDFESYRQVASRAGQVFADYNPDAEFYIDTDVIGRDDCDFLQLTFMDNELLSESERDEILQYKEKGYFKDGTIKNTYWANLWNVYGLGNIGNLQGVVFSNWKQIDQLPSEARLVGIGLDFGYSVDPTAIIEVYNYNGTRILNELKYQIGMLNSDIAKTLPKNVIVYADSSEPKSIDEIKRYGITIKGVTKGKDSINYGIDVIQQQEYLVTSNSVNLIKELRAYCWDVDKHGTRLNKPIDNNNHAIDAFRYHEMETLGLKRNYGTYNIR